MQLSNALALYQGANPFCSPEAILASNYSAFLEGRLVRVLDFRAPTASAQMAHSAIRAFLAASKYPCVGAKSVLHRASYRFGHYGRISGAGTIPGLARDLCAFLAERHALKGSFASFIAAFEDEGVEEEGFEAALWGALARLRSADDVLHEYAPGFSRDPADRNYAFSFCATAFFVVGMHPRSQRLARRAPYPLLVFNPHDQFKRLRETNGWDRFKDVVRRKEIELQGSLNPNLSDFGDVSEARQYSGKAAPDRWTCPVRIS